MLSEQEGFSPQGTYLHLAGGHAFIRLTDLEVLLRNNSMSYTKAEIEALLLTYAGRSDRILYQEYRKYNTIYLKVSQSHTALHVWLSEMHQEHVY